MKARAFLEAEKPGQRRVKRTCELLEVSKAAYYQSLKAEPSNRARSDAELGKLIAQVHRVSDGTYGSPRVHAELAQRGVACGRRRVARLMRLAGLEGRCKRRWRTTTVQSADEQRALDLIKRHFGPSAEIDTRYVGDITYVWTWSGFAYLATVIDLASRRVVGWAVADHMRTKLVEDALHMAFARRRPASGVIFHSDRGSQYTSKNFAALARANGVRLSLGSTGCAYDNAVAESFFASIKRELISTRAWRSVTELRRAVFNYVEGWYNTRRLHSSLSYLSPAQWEALHRDTAVTVAA
jgi:transposase InsO family protein